MRRFFIPIMLLLLVAPIIVFGVPTTITIDGDNSDWVGIPLVTSDTGAMSMGEGCWNDATGDNRADNGNSYDLEDMRITHDDTYLYFYIEFNSLTTLGTNGDPWIQITLDTDMISGSGNQDYALSCETKVNTDAAWEYLLLIDLAHISFANTETLIGDGNEQWNGGNSLDLLDTSWSDVSTVNEVVYVNTTTNSIEVQIQLSTLGSPTGMNFSIAMARSTGLGDTWDVGGVSDVMDCMTTAGPNTWNEVSDGYIDFFFDWSFDNIKNVKDLVINEFQYNPNQVADANGEYLEIYNNTLSDIGLDEGSGFWICDDGTNKSNLIHDAEQLNSNAFGVWGLDNAPLTNGGFTTDGIYTNFLLANVSDEIVICHYKKEIDRVNYDTVAWGGVPGFSFERISYSGLSDQSNFALAITTYGDGDYGTPGWTNSVYCPGGEVPPSAVYNLEVTGKGFNYVTLQWTAPGDDANCNNTATAYDFRYSNSDITSEADWNAATQASEEPSPKSGGSIQQFTIKDLASEQTFYFAMKTVDDEAKWSDMSNVVSAYTGVLYANGSTTISFDPNDGYHIKDWVTNIRLRNNHGSSSAQGVIATIVDCDTWAIIMDNSSSFPNINSGQEQWSGEAEPYKFDCSNRPPGENYLKVWFNIDYTLSGKGKTSELSYVLLEIPTGSPVPHNIAAESVDAGIKLTWDAVDGADGYNVYKLINETWTKLNGVLIEKTVYLDKNVQDGIEYLYKIKSISDGLESGFSEIVKVVFEETYETLDEIVSYPNPAKDKVTFGKLPKGSKVSIYTMTGELVYTLTVKNAKSEWYLINKAGKKVGNGIYFYVVKFNGKTKTGKIAIIK